MRHQAISLDDTASIDGVPNEYFFISPEEIPSTLANRSELAELVKEEIEKLPHYLKAASHRRFAPMC